MVRHCILILSVLILAIGTGQPAPAEHPSTLTPYRFLPRFSVLNQSGGIAGVDIDFRVHGRFDLLLDDDHEPPWGNTATFENVQAWAAHPILAYVLDMDDVLNLSGLKGEQLPVAGPFDAYRFTGIAQDGSSVDLFASVIGPWLYLNGGTTPPDGSADYFEYELRAIARTRPYADFDENGIVDADDLDRWRAHFGDPSPSGVDVTSWGDANGDNAIDGRDFLEWQRQVGEMAPPLAALEAGIAEVKAGLASITAVPEPSAIWLVATGAMAIFGRRRHT
jgi:hypothetical protein